MNKSTTSTKKYKINEDIAHKVVERELLKDTNFVKDPTLYKYMNEFGSAYEKIDGEEYDITDNLLDWIDANFIPRDEVEEVITTAYEVGMISTLAQIRDDNKGRDINLIINKDEATLNELKSNLLSPKK